MIYLAILLILAILTYLYFRTVWLIKHLNVFLSVMEVYFSEPSNKNLTESQIREYLKIWCLAYIYLEFHKWDFTRYVIHKDIYQQAAEIFIKHVTSIIRKTSKNDLN